MTIFTRTRRNVPPAPADKPPVVAYSNASASVSVSGSGNRWELAVKTVEGISGVFLLDSRRTAVGAAEWLSYQDLTGVGSKSGPALTWHEFVDRINDKRDRAVTMELADAFPELSDPVLEHVIHVHYAQVLASKERRKMWRKLLRDVETLERAQQVRRDAR